MLYYLFEYLEKEFQFPGASLFTFISFRASISIILSLLISTMFGKSIINYLRSKQIGENIRDLGLKGQMEKAGTPTMGGLIIILATIIPVLLFSKLDNIYIILLILTMIWMGTIGFIDDYIKKFKNNKDGLKGRYKIIGQVLLGIIVGSTLFFHQDVTIKDKIVDTQIYELVDENTPVVRVETKSTRTTIPFLKNNEFNYSDLVTWIHPNLEKYTWIVHRSYYQSLQF